MTIIQVNGEDSNPLNVAIDCSTTAVSTFECEGTGFNDGAFNPDQVKVPFMYPDSASVIFRCDVVVGGADGVTATKMIYAEAIKVGYVYSPEFKLHNGEYYMFHGDGGLGVGDSVEIQIFGDNAEPFIVDPTTQLLDGHGAEIHLGGVSRGSGSSTVAVSMSTSSGTGITSLVYGNIGSLDSTKTYDMKINTIIFTREDGQMISSSPETLLFAVYPVCGNGEYYDFSTSSCLGCSGGKRDNGDEQFKGCVSCPLGECPNNGACGTPPANYIAVGGWSCVECPAGTEADGTTCALCQIGTAGYACEECDPSASPPEYASGNGFEECLLCNGIITANKCTQCTAGHGQDIDDNSNPPTCSVCSAGSYSPYGVCVNCPPGKFQPESGQTSCMVCPVGKYQSQPGSTACVACSGAYGEYSSITGSAACESVRAGEMVVQGHPATAVAACPVGYYRAADMTPYTQCVRCPSGTYNEIAGQSGCTNIPNGHIFVDSLIKCATGTFQEGNECMSCERAKGEYQTAAGTAFCNIAPPGTALITSQTAPIPCQTGFYGNSLFECAECQAAEGQYQDEVGRSFCKIVVPGYELAANNPTASRPVPCQQGTYSKGSSPSCTPCDPIMKEYQNTDTSAYCKICPRGEVNENATACDGVSCPEDTITMLQISDDPFVFTETAANEYIVIPCQSSDTSNHAEKVSRLCFYDEESNAASWGTANFLKCRTKLTADLEQLQKDADGVGSLTTVDDMAVWGSSIADLSTSMKMIVDEAKFTSRDVVDTGGPFSSIINLLEAEVPEPDFTGMTREEITEATKNYKTQKKVVTEAKTELRNSMTSMVDVIAESGTDSLNEVSDVDKLIIVKAVESMAAGMEGDAPIINSNMAVEYIPLTAGNGGPVRVPLSQPSGTASTDIVSLEFESDDGTVVTGLAVSVYRQKAKGLFPPPKSTNTLINSNLISMKIATEGAAKDFRFTLRIKSNLTQDEFYSKQKKHLERICSFFNDTINEWSSYGCTTTNAEDDGYINCTCNHTTSFAILLSISDIEDKSQEYVSLVMFVINIIFLILTFLAIAPFRKYRKRRLIVIQNQLVLSLILANVGFQILSLEAKVHVDPLGRPLFSLNVGCIIGVILVQYLFLTVMAWMSCCSYTLYGKIVDAVKSFGRIDKFYIHKACAVCWVVPLIFPTSAYLTASLMNDYSDMSSVAWPVPYIGGNGKNETNCWVEAPWKWVSFMLPCYICLIANCAVFVMIALVVSKADKGGSGFGRQVKALVTVAVTVGVPWIIGVMTFEPIALVGQWLFIILTGLQGPIMFLTFVLLQEDVLITLLEPFGMKYPRFLKPLRTSKAEKTSSTSHSVLAEKKADAPSQVKTVDEEKPEEEAIYCNDPGKLGVKNDPDETSLASNFPEPI